MGYFVSGSRRRAESGTGRRGERTCRRPMSGMALPAVSAAMAGQSRAAGPALAIAHARPRAQLYFVDVGQAVADGFPDIRRADVLAAAHGYVVRHGIQILARREPCVQKSLGCRLYGKGTQQGCAAPPEFLRPDAFLPLRHGQTRQFSRYPSDGCTAYAAAVPGRRTRLPAPSCRSRRRPRSSTAGAHPNGGADPARSPCAYAG